MWCFHSLEAVKTQSEEKNSGPRYPNPLPTSTSWRLGFMHDERRPHITRRRGHHIEGARLHFKRQHRPLAHKHRDLQVRKCRLTGRRTASVEGPHSCKLEARGRAAPNACAGMAVRCMTEPLRGRGVERASARCGLRVARAPAGDHPLEEAAHVMYVFT